MTDQPIAAYAGLKGLTWEEFLNLPFETRHCALIDGEIIVNSPNHAHQLCVHNIWRALGDWYHGAPGRGEASTEQPVGISERRGYQPDLAWYPQEQCAPLDAKANVTGVPAIVVEVFSPSTRRFDLVRKQHDYAVVGVQELWFVDPDEESVMVASQPSDAGGFTSLVERAKGDVLTSPLLDVFAMPVVEVFRR